MRLLIIPALLSLSACARSDADPAAKPAAPAVHVSLVTASEQPTRDTLMLTGELAADEHSELTADISGRVVAVSAERGQRVKKGDALVRLDVRTAALSTAEAHANLEAAKSDRRLAEQECARSHSLLASGAITKSAADRDSAHCESALQRVSAAEARADLLAKGITDGVIRAPFDGVVAARNVAIGEWVAPGRSLVTLVGGGPLRVELAVPEAHVAAVRLGQPVEIRSVSRPGSYAATVTRIGAEVGKARALTVEATVEATPDLLPGMFVEAHVAVGSTPRLTLPATAVVQRGTAWHAFVARDGMLEDHIVKLGPPPAAGQVSIARGITKTDRVVVAVTDQIVDGLRVE